MKIRIHRFWQRLPDTTILFFALYSSWMLSVPFLGQALNARVEELGSIVPPHINLIATLAIFAGLLATGLLVTDESKIKYALPPAMGIGLAGTLVFLTPISPLWDVAAVIISFSTGIVVATWGYYYRKFQSPASRLHAAANAIILSNIGMIIIDTVAVNLSPRLGICLSIGALTGAIALYAGIEKRDPNFIPSPLPRGANITPPLPPRNREDLPAPLIADRDSSAVLPPRSRADLPTEPLLRRALALLYIFIVIITVDSGLMYQVVRPAFAHHAFLTSFYWAIPYIGAIAFMKTIPERVRRSHILYVAVSMIGFAFILFHALDTSAASYIAVDTLMLGAFGICDLFWWVILGELLAYADNPAKIFGAGLSANILGVLIGGIAGEQYVARGGSYDTVAAAALGVVLVSLLTLPYLYENLARVIENQVFLEGLFAKRSFSDAQATQAAEPGTPVRYAAPGKDPDATGHFATTEEEPSPSGRHTASEHGSDVPAHHSAAHSASAHAHRPPKHIPGRMAVAAEVFQLTGREAEIAELLSSGHTYKMISHELFISENTVKTHIKNIYSKMNVRNKTEFLEMAKITRKV